MTLQRIREICLALPDATEQIQWGKDLVFKIGGKMFCVACTKPVEPPKVAMSFKCDDETFAELIERAGVIPAPYMAKHKWVALEQYDTIDMNQLRPLLTRAFEIVSAKLPKKKNATTKLTKKSKGAKAKSVKTAKNTRDAKATSKKPARRAAPARARRGR
jgi:predicted DNA-binding protein (MmcQ/YjbR family)